MKIRENLQGQVLRNANDIETLDDRVTTLEKSGMGTPYTSGNGIEISDENEISISENFEITNNEIKFTFNGENALFTRGTGTKIGIQGTAPIIRSENAIGSMSLAVQPGEIFVTKTSLADGVEQYGMLELLKKSTQIKFMHDMLLKISVNGIEGYAHLVFLDKRSTAYVTLDSYNNKDLLLTSYARTWNSDTYNSVSHPMDRIYLHFFTDSGMLYFEEEYDMVGSSGITSESNMSFKVDVIYDKVM